MPAPIAAAFFIWEDTISGKQGSLKTRNREQAEKLLHAKNEGIMLALLSEMARSEVEVLRERINSGLAEALRKGVKLGRPKGSSLDAEVFLQKHKDIIRLLKAGQSVRNAAKIAGKGISTVQRVKKIVHRVERMI